MAGALSKEKRSLAKRLRRRSAPDTGTFNFFKKIITKTERYSRGADQSASNEAVKRRISLGGLVAAQHPKRRVIVVCPCPPATRRLDRLRQQGVDAIPGLLREQAHLVVRQAPRALLVQAAEDGAARQPAGDEVQRPRHRCEDVGAHLGVVVAPLLARPVEVDLVLEQGADGEVVGALGGRQPGVEVGQRAGRDEAAYDER